MSLKKGDRLPVEMTSYAVALVFRRKDNHGCLLAAAHNELVGGISPLEIEEVKSRAVRAVQRRWGEYTASDKNAGNHDRWELHLWHCVSTFFGPNRSDVSDEIRVIASGMYVSFGEMTWPAVGEPTADVGWKLRYAGDGLTKSDRLFAASVVDAYLALVAKTTRERSKVIAQLRRACRMSKHKEKA